MIHSDQCGHALGGPEPEQRNIRRCRHGVAVERHDSEDVTGQRETSNFGGAGVQDVKEHALALLHPDGVAVSQHTAINREQIVADLKPFGLLFGLSVGRTPHLLQRRDRSADECLHRHVAAAAESGRELLHHQKDFAIVGARIVQRFDVDRSGLTGVRPTGQVAAGDYVRVIEAKPRRAGHEGDAPHPVRGHERRALFGCAIDIARNHLAVPVNQLRRVGVVVQIHNDTLPLLESQKRPGELAVIEGGGDDMFR